MVSVVVIIVDGLCAPGEGVGEVLPNGGQRDFSPVGYGPSSMSATLGRGVCGDQAVGASIPSTGAGGCGTRSGVPSHSTHSSSRWGPRFRGQTLSPYGS